MLYSLLKPVLFWLDPEEAHNLIISLARLGPALGKLTGIKTDNKLRVKIGSLYWSFPVGLAAGLDKNAEALDFFSHQGFGALECGTLTLKGQQGNPRPRMFRYPEEKSLRNSMGFPNQGLDKTLARLRRYQSNTPLGINLGKNKKTSTEESILELSYLFEQLKKLADYFVINVSSPNTPGLRALQEKSYLTELFKELNSLRQGQDLYLKIAPDLTIEKIKELTFLCAEMKLTGIIATNTTIMPSRGAGGVSGELLKQKSRDIRRLILRENAPIELIAVGGISRPEDVFELWKDGGKVAQIYTSYVYQGPEILKRFQKAFLLFTKRQGLSLEEFFKLPLEERRYRLN